MQKDRILRFLTSDGVHQLYLLSLDKVMTDIEAIRPLSELSRNTMAHAVSLALLRSNNLKGASQTLSFQFDFLTDLKKVIATAKANGDVKGYVDNANACVPLTSAIISCTADLGLKTPYHSSVFVSGETMEDKINCFFSQSDQTTLIYLSNIPDSDQGKDGSEIVALLYHHLPVEGGESFVFDKEKAKKALDGRDLESIAKEIFGEVPYEKVSEEPVRFHCDCSKKRFEGLLETMPDKDLKELVEKAEPTVTTCGWCGKSYSFEPYEIQGLLAKRNN